MSIANFDLRGHCALVTGASSGLGAHFSKVLADAGADVILAARRKERLDELAEEIRGDGGQPFSVRMDVTEESSVAEAIDLGETHCGPIDILVNNAGIAPTLAFLKTDDATWRNVLETNLVGAARVARLLVGRVATSPRRCSIVNVASGLGVRAMPFVSAYAASKAGLIHLTRAMAMELARHSIRVNTLIPGFYDTGIVDLETHPGLEDELAGQIPLGRIGSVEDLDGALLLLCSDASRFMTGSTITVDGGHSINSW